MENATWENVLSAVSNSTKSGGKRGALAPHWEGGRGQGQGCGSAPTLTYQMVSRKEPVV